MNQRENIFHLAIPSRSLQESKEYYLKLGLKVAREYSDHLNFNFFGHQLVCHFAPDKVDKSPQMYPRHFGITMTDKQEFLDFLTSCKEKQFPFFQDLFTRFEGKREEHSSFMLVDPSNNVLEFKYYNDKKMIY